MFPWQLGEAGEQEKKPIMLVVLETFTHIDDMETGCELIQIKASECERRVIVGFYWEWSAVPQKCGFN